MAVKFLAHLINKLSAYWNQRKSPLFSSTWYAETYPESKKSFLPPYWHYVFIGYKLGYNPSPAFIGKVYWNMHFAHRTNRCPLIHYAMYGDESQLKYYGQSALDNGFLTDEDLESVKNVPDSQHKVLLLSHESSLTGAPRALLNMASCLKKIGCHVVFWTMKDGPLRDEVTDLGIEYKYPVLCFSKETEDARFLDAACNYINHFDTVVLNTIVALPFIDMISRCTARKVCWIHDGSYGFRSWSFLNDFPRLVEMFDLSLVVGDYAKKIALSYAQGRGNLQNLFYYIDDNEGMTAMWPVADDENKVKIVLAGTIEERKGHADVVKALSLLSSDVLNSISIIVVGACVSTALMAKMQSCSASCLHILGPKSHDLLLSYFRGMDILLCPSTDDPMPIVCTEAMMFNKPVIVGSNTGTASFISHGQNGYVVQSGDPQSLANVISEVVLHRGELRDMGTSARKIFEDNFTEKSFELNLRNLFLESCHG